MMLNCDPEGQGFLSAPNNHGRLFFLHILLSPVFDYNVGVTVVESSSCTLASAIMKVDVICDVAMMSSPNVLTTELHDLQCNQCIDNMRCFSFSIYPTVRIRVCKTRFVSTVENRAKPCLVCKKVIFMLVFLMSPQKYK